MFFKRILLCAALALAAGQAHAEDCQLKMLASLDAIISEDGVLVPVTVDGKSGDYFKLNLNASFSDFSQSEAVARHLRQLPVPHDIFLISYGHLITRSVSPSLQLGVLPVELKLAMSAPPTPKDTRVVGAFGLDVLKKFDVELDLAHNKVNLFSPDHCKGQVIYWTHTAPAAAAPMLSQGTMLDARSVRAFYIGMQLDGKDVTAQIELEQKARISSVVARERFDISQGDAGKTVSLLTFKSLSLDGISILNPQFVVDPIDQNTGCSPDPFADDVDVKALHLPKITRCVGQPDVTIGLQELLKLRVFLSFKESAAYITAADAH